MSDHDQTRPTEAKPHPASGKGPAKIGVYDRPSQPAWRRWLPWLIAIAVIIALIIVFWGFNASAGGPAVAMTAAAALPSAPLPPEGSVSWPTRPS